ncbi:hypothetical protein E2C01_086005 [Portunus trituberculatus]|uniref:Uncharacterized protein n=1 Tax=Portunus trituberculatus TaxID=210409 RepID=A0A5B7JCB0_PORTR|nr:hypothetical protein [Portunus trituberculatus]
MICCAGLVWSSLVWSGLFTVRAPPEAVIGCPPMATVGALSGDVISSPRAAYLWLCCPAAVCSLIACSRGAPECESVFMSLPCVLFLMEFVFKLCFFLFLYSLLLLCMYFFSFSLSLLLVSLFSSACYVLKNFRSRFWFISP